MKLDRAQVLGLLFVVAMIAITVALYPRLPDPVPTRWSSRMQADDFTPKPWGAFVHCLLMGGTWLLFLVLPRISPRGFGFEGFRRVWQIIQVSILGFFFLASTTALLTAAGVTMMPDRLIEAAVGLLAIILGNFLGKLRKNFFVGIKTPWTLASDEVWLRTHRLGGKLTVVAGFVLLIASIAGFGIGVGIACVIAAALIPALYSFILYRRLNGFAEASQEESSSR